MAKFITLHLNGCPIAYNVEGISRIKGNCIELNRSMGYECYVDETFDEIMILIAETNVRTIQE